jgi:hypothetical protein
MLHRNLKNKIANGFVRLEELKPNSRELAKRLLASGALYVDGKGYLKLNGVE